MRTETQNRSKGRIVFLIFAITLFLTCGALTAGGLFRLYKMAAAYELSSPDNLAKSTLDIFKDERYDEIISLCDIHLSEFETADDFAAALNEAAPVGSYTFSKTGNGSYRLQRGESPLADLTLTCQKGAGEYGFDIWQVEKLEFIGAKTQDYTVTASPELSPMVNGVLLKDSLIDESKSEKYKEDLGEAFGNLAEELLPQAPSVYHVEGLYCPPVVTVDAPKKSKSIVRTLENDYSVILYPTGDVITELSEIAASAAETYARYITNDASLDEVLPYFLPDSQYYRHLKEFYNGWYNTHDSYLFEQPKFASWQIYDENHVSCVILFNYKITMGRHQYEYPSKYNMSFIKTDSGWKLSNLIVI